MTPQKIEIRDQQKSSWNNISPGWKKWDEFTMQFLKPMGDDIVMLLDPDPSDHILDVATGTGEPGLSIASRVPEGRVIGIDISEGMIRLANENARAKELFNFEGVVCDVCELPFPDNSFDNISCRMGFMFFPDLLLGVTEMFRVLKPAGHIATCVWDGPENNSWVTAMTNSVKKFVDIPQPPPGSPGMFRCAAPGFMTDLLQTAGFYSVREKRIEGQIRFENVDHYWQITNDISPTLKGIMDRTPETTRMAIKDDLFETLSRHQTNEGLLMKYQAIMLYGKK